MWDLTKYLRWLHSKLPFTESDICIRLMIMEGDPKYHWPLPQPCLTTFGVNFIECHQPPDGWKKYCKRPVRTRTINVAPWSWKLNPSRNKSPPTPKRRLQHLNTMPKRHPQPSTPPDLPTPPTGAEKRGYYIAGAAVWYCREGSRSHWYPESREHRNTPQFVLSSKGKFTEIVCVKLLDSFSFLLNLVGEWIQPNRVHCLDSSELIAYPGASLVR